MRTTLLHRGPSGFSHGCRPVFRYCSCVGYHCRCQLRTEPQPFSLRFQRGLVLAVAVGAAKRPFSARPTARDALARPINRLYPWLTRQLTKLLYSCAANGGQRRECRDPSSRSSGGLSFDFQSGSMSAATSCDEYLAGQVTSPTPARHLPKVLAKYLPRCSRPFMAPSVCNATRRGPSCPITPAGVR